MKKNYLKSMLKKSGHSFKGAVFSLALCSVPGLFLAQQTYSFTNCGATGNFGPTQSAVTLAYSATNLSLTATTGATTGIQTWTVPYTGQYRILAVGAKGGDGAGQLGGNGATMQGDFTLNGGDVIKILVGQIGGSRGNNGANTSGAGGGGSFVTYTNNVPLIVAGGGGGAGQSQAGLSGTTSVDGTNGNQSPGIGGINGGGGGGAMSGAAGTSVIPGGTGTSCSYGSGGGGFYTRGGYNCSGSLPLICGESYTAGGFGGPADANTAGVPGGFGGGAGVGHRAAGGGGWSGGGADGGTGPGGGGGSFNSGSNQVNAAGTNTTNGKVVITELCSISLSTTANPICAGTSVTLTTNAVSGYSWSTGSTASVIVVTPSVNTSYSLVGTSSLNCISSSVISITVAAGLPVLAIAGGSNNANVICPGKSATLTASGAASYTWSGNVVNGVPFSPTTTAQYTVTGSNACGTSTASIGVTVNPTPTISITASTASLCSGNTATIIVGGVPTSTISNGVQNGVSFMPQLTTVYSATGTSALGCTATAQTTITVVQTPTAFPGAAPALICLGGTSTISASGAQGYTWSTGSNQPSFTDSPTITTVYTVTKTNGPCQDIKSVTLTVAPLPFILALTNPSVVCSLKQVTLNAGGAQTYTWAPYGGIGNGIVVTPTVTTIFTVTGNDGTCSNTGTVLLNVLPNPTISIAATSTVLCLGECATLTLGGASTYTWFTAGLTGTNVNQCPTGTTSYSVAGTNSVGCTTGNTRVLVVNPVPNVNVFTNKPMVCSGQGSTLTVNGANTYTWSTGPLGTVSVVNPQTTSVYTVTGFLNGTGCNTTKTIQVTVFSPTFQVPSTASSCIGGTVNLCASGADSYTWNGNFSFPCISVSPSVYTIYQVSATSTSLNINNSPVSCLSSNTVGVSIYLNPTITIAASRTTICKGESTNLTGIGGTTFTWSTFQQGTTVPVNPFVQTTYTVLGADANGCQGTAAIQIKVGQCTGLDELSSGVTQFIVFPNPNTGEFTIKSDQALHLQLVNEIGQVILAIDLKPENGHSKTITDLPNGVYFITGENNNSGMSRKVIVNK